jgi:putative ABC transport system ATP-binding protein
MITRPDVVFADEPTGALDSRSGQRLLSFLRAGSRDLGQTIVMVTHDPIAASYAGRWCYWPMAGSPATSPIPAPTT